MTFKILSLDGGGIRGVLSATILQEIEKTLIERKKPGLHEYFDLIAGTSTGSILAAAIACKKQADELVKLYNDEGKNIFLEQVRWQRKWRWLGKLIASKALYPHSRGNKGLSEVLKRQLIDKTLNKCPKIGEIDRPNLLLLAYDVFSRNTTWFANDDPTEWYNDIELWEICTASASAPTFFPPYKLLFRSTDQFLPHIDGGVSANNPELVAIAHALSMQTKKQPQPKINEIAVLSIGTGQTTRPYTYDQIKNWGLLEWVKNIPNIFLNPSAENSQYISKRIFLSIGLQHYLRLDFALNEWFEERKSEKLPQLLNTPYNKYIYKKTQERKQISEDIDNPDICQVLIEAAQCYLEYGKVGYNGQQVPVKSAIQQFIDSH